MLVYLQAIIAVFTAIPELVKIFKTLIESMKEQPEDVVAKAGKVFGEVKNAETEEDRQKAAKAVADLIKKG